MDSRRLTTLLILTLAASSPPAVVRAEPPAATVAAPTTFNLTQCVELALQRHPRIAAQAASLAAAEDGCRALDALRLPAIVATPDLPVRRKQAGLGVTAAAAGLDEAERETVFAVTSSYMTVIYAREQERVARGVIDRLTSLRDNARRQLDAGAPGVTSVDVSRTAVYVRLAETRRIESSQGAKRALAALREAIGLPCDAGLDVPADKLPESDARPSRDETVAGALARRGDLTRAAVFADASALEVCAQASSHQKKLETFAAGSDVHSTTVPPGQRSDPYRPGGIPPEMPTLLAGPTAERVRHARSLQARGAAVLESTRGLIVLEAEDAFLRWEQASLQAAEALRAADEADRLADDLTKDFTSGAKVKVDEVLTARVLASQARAQANEFLYKKVLTLAELERVTGGAFCAGLSAPVAPRPRPAPPAEDAR
jgi:outer membrane protein TolC